MAKKSTVVYTLDLLVHVEFKENISFKTMQNNSEAVQDDINHIKQRVQAAVNNVTIDKTIIQKNVTY